MKGKQFVFLNNDTHSRIQDPLSFDNLRAHSMGRPNKRKLATDLKTIRHWVWVPYRYRRMDMGTVLVADMFDKIL